MIQFHANEYQGGGGSGLGLYISKKIADLHHARLSLSSCVGKGSTFSLEIPAICGSAKNFHNSEFRRPSENDFAALEEGNSETSRIRFESMNVLVVDDSVLNRKLLVRLLESRGHRCTEAIDGKDSLRILDQTLLGQEGGFDVVLMDNNMPQLSGQQATEAMRLRGYNGVIIGVTGDAQQKETIIFLNHGADAILSKPVDPTALEALIQTHFRRKKKEGRIK